MIKAIIFDYGGVLKIDTGPGLEKIIKYLGTTREKWEKEWFLGSREANNSGKPHHDYFLEVCLKFKNDEGVEDFVKRFLEESKGKHVVNKDLVDIIIGLKSSGFKIGLLSNYDVILRDKLRADGIYELFDSIIISAEVKYIKPEPEIFKLSFAELGVLPEETVFIDDTPKSLEGADIIGYHPILFRDNESFKAELEKITGFSL